MIGILILIIFEAHEGMITFYHNPGLSNKPIPGNFFQR